MTDQLHELRLPSIREAAPEMFAILCELVNPDDFDQHPQDFTEVWHRARAIISKAEGFT